VRDALQEWYGKQDSTTPVTVPTDTPIEATATNVTIKVEAGTTPNVDLGSVEGAPITVQSD
jgi:hypothetical protein